MAIRPPRRAAARPALGGAQVHAGMGGIAATAASSAPEAEAAVAASDTQREIFDLLEQSLRATAQPGDDEDLDFVIEHMRKAVSGADLRPATSTIDRTAWVDTLESLASEGLLDGDERENLIRQFGEAGSVLHSRDAQVALELARRIERDGERAAMEWLASQRAGHAPTHGAGATIDDGPVAGKQSITRSRSRRLRGPPGSD
ncbi:hypothetical protein ACQYVW_05415 [Luteimonas sp. SDU82]